MPKPREEYMHILCSDRAYLAPLHLMGPVVHPLKVNKKAVVRLLTNGCTVYEVNLETKATVQLTLMNINDNSRFEQSAEAAKPEAAKPIMPVTTSGVPKDTKDQAPADPEADQPKEQVVEDETKEPESAGEPESTQIEDTDSGTAQDDKAEKDKVESYEFVLNEHGKVDESKIDWSQFTKEERRVLRTRITAVNAEAAASAKV